MIFTLQGKDLANPLLLHIKDEEKYKNADIKIMFFGQETNSWNGELGSKGMAELLNIYSDFLENTYSSQFWNAVGDYVNSIKELNPNKSVEFVWNNILKIGKENGKGKPKQDLVDLQKKVFPVIREEVEILSPDLIIFFTGPYYDKYIKKEWNNSLIQEVTPTMEGNFPILIMRPFLKIHFGHTILIIYIGRGRNSIKKLKKRLSLIHKFIL